MASAGTSAQPHSAAAKLLTSALSHTSAGVDGRSGSNINEIMATTLQVVILHRKGYENSNRHYAPLPFSDNELHTVPYDSSAQETKAVTHVMHPD